MRTSLRKTMTVACMLVAAAASVPAALARDLIVAGQSNAVALYGRAAEQSTYAVGDTFADVTIWNTALAPDAYEALKFAENTSTQPVSTTPKYFGPEFTMAERFKQLYPTEPLRFVKVARGGTSLFMMDEWNPNGTDNLLTKLEDQIDDADLTAQCMLWFQGEADRREDPAMVKSLFLQLIARVRAATGNPNMIVVWPLLSYAGPGTDAFTDAYRTMQTQTVNQSDGSIRTIVLDDQMKVYGDNLHYTATSILAIGRRAFNRCNNAN